jgi:hypothetical protein
VFGRVARVLAVLGLAVLPTVLLSTGPAAALCVGSSLCNPANAPLLAEFATSAGPSLTTAARTAGALSGASTAAPVSAVPLASTATAAGAGSSVWGAAVGKIVTLLGGIAGFGFLVPDSTDPGLPSGTNTGIHASLDGGAVWMKYAGATPWLIDPFTVQFTANWSTTDFYNGVPRTATWTYNFVGVDRPNTTACTSTNGLYCTTTSKATALAAYHKCWTNSAQTTVSASWTGPVSGSFSQPATTPGTWSLSSTSNPCTYGLSQIKWSASPHADTGIAPSEYIVNVSTPVTGQPVRHIEQTVTCKTSAGVITTVTNSTASTVWAANQMVEVAGLMCPVGSRAVGVEAVVKTDGGADLVVVNEPYVEGAGLDAATGDVPEICYTSTDCTLQLERRTSTETDTYARVNPDNYPDWWEDPARDYLYRCVYGSSTTWIVVPIANCSIYRDPGPEWADPVSDTDVPESDPAGDCNFGWSDLLTGGIFVRGGKCILTWAFVPSDGFMNAKVDEIRTSWDGTAPVVVFQTANSVWGPWYQARTVPSGCEGPSLTITNMVNDAHPFTACGEIAQAVVPIGKPLIAGVVLVGAVLGAARTLGRSFGIDASSRGEPM